jgi:tetratricopeptide (TPR) repeat protein
MRSGLQLNPNEVVLRQRVAEDLLRLEKLDDSIREFQSALSSQPGNESCADGLTRALYLKSQKESQGAFVFSNDFEKAKVSLDKAIQLRPNDLKLRLAKAKIRALSGEPVDLSTIGQPTNDPERIAYAEALLAQNKFSESSEMMRDVVAHTGAPDQLFALGDLAVMIKDYDSADAAYKKVAGMDGQSERAKRGLYTVSQDRENARQHATLGLDLAKRKQLASAVDTFRGCIANDPRLAEARLGLADAEQKLLPDSPKSLRDSAAQYKAYIALSPTLPIKQQQKYSKKLAKLETRATKLEAKQSKQRGQG